MTPTGVMIGPSTLRLPGQYERFLSLREAAAQPGDYSIPEK
jgi:hypothetical protein